jgi:hypothetical protein
MDAHMARRHPSPPFPGNYYERPAIEAWAGSLVSATHAPDTYTASLTFWKGRLPFHAGKATTARSRLVPCQSLTKKTNPQTEPKVQADRCENGIPKRDPTWEECIRRKLQASSHIPREVASHVPFQQGKR